MKVEGFKWIVVGVGLGDGVIVSVFFLCEFRVFDKK